MARSFLIYGLISERFFLRPARREVGDGGGLRDNDGGRNLKHNLKWMTITSEER